MTALDALTPVKQFDELWARMARILSFSLGIWILYHETFDVVDQRPYLYAAAIALIGPQMALVIERALVTVGQIVSLITPKPPEHPQPPPTDKDQK